MKKIIATQEMLNDLALMGDVDYCKKWNVSKPIPIRLRRDFGIKPYNNQHGTKEHKFEDGIEYKWCQKGHWDVLSQFNKDRTRYDGLCGFCKLHLSNSRKRCRENGDYKERIKKYHKTDSGRKMLRNVWRRQKAKKDNAYVSWTNEDEDKALKLFEGRCAYCGKEVPPKYMEFDHFVPIASGGKTEPSNMLPCCKKCNHGKEGKFTQDALEWLIKKFGSSRGNVIFLDIKNKLGLLGTPT